MLCITAAGRGVPSQLPVPAAPGMFDSGMEVVVDSSGMLYFVPGVPGPGCLRVRVGDLHHQHLPAGELECHLLQLGIADSRVGYALEAFGYI